MLEKQSISYSQILKLAFPIIIGGIAQNIIMATDAFFMAMVDEVSLDAVGLAGLFFSTVYILGLGFSIGVQILIARRHGEKDYASIGAIFDNSLIFLGTLSLFLWAGMEWIGPMILKSLIHSDAVYQSAILYLDDRSWGITFALVNLAFRSFFIGISSSAIISWSTFATAAANIVLNYGLIFGNFGMPAMGISGAAIASSLAEIVGTIAFLAYVFAGKFHQSFQLFAQWKWKKDVMAHITKIASPVMFQYFISHAGWFLFFIIVEQAGERALAISVIIRIIYMFQMVPFWGFSSATNTLVSHTIGEGNLEQVMPLLKRITMLSLIGSLIFIIPNLLFPEWVLSLAIQDNSTALIQQSIPTLYVISGALLFFGLAMTWFSGVTGSGNTRTALLIETCTIAVYLIVAWFLGIYMKGEVHEIWYTEPFYFAVMGIVSFWYMSNGKWKNKKI